MALAAVASGAYAASASASTYTVQKGDTLSAIASKYQTSVVDLKTLNNLASDLIRISQTLQIPDGAAAPSVQASAPAQVSTYTVVKGDTLSAIARRNNISLTELRQWNNLSGDLIIPGQQLKVAGGTSTQPAAQPQAAAAPSSTSDYVIQSGDTLSKIAIQFGTSVTTLQQLNGLSSDRIYAGQTLKVSGSAPAPTVAAAPAPTPIVQAKSSTYTVQSGDTLSGIARQFSTTVDTISQLNGLSSTRIYVGQTLKVTGQPAAAAAPIQKVSTSADTSNSADAAQVTLIAKSLVGSSYVWGGNTTAGFDCSGLIYYVYNKAGLSLARYSADGYANRSYEVDKPVPGDLVFFSNTYTTGISHVGIYLGGDSFVQAADEKHGVIISSLSNTYYKQHFDHFARFY
ncbi:LysM peptidoglycan-binding domain-containing protein [Neobacillus sp. PS3-12]|uniref:C40 family peptidase n=1 Tax=Neobacillus sp. PS3-12 TaxID=3070677 RepID=UPI0027DEAFFC|nr:LysM peptidoglycan-binding domain-containing protein [Neobacillus sp. PS3-12]WML55712.1 LysM peptidoglycan-binding domain-containing protein [Neobacillus sp. PS3-12]